MIDRLVCQIIFFGKELNITAKAAESAKIGIYNIRGQKIKDLSSSLCHPELAEGREEYRVTWDGRDESNKPVSSGVYYCKIESGIDVAVKKMVLVK